MNSPPVPDFLQPWLGSGALAAWLFYAGVACAGAIVLLALYLRLGRGPRRRRAYRRARRLVHAGNWREALAEVEMIRSLGRLSPAWQGRARNAEGEARRVAGEAALKAQHYEESLEHFVAGADLLGLNKSDARGRVIDAMLEEVRRLFATTTGPDTAEMHQLLARILAVQPAQAEALFWQGLGHVRDDHYDQAVTSLLAAREASVTRVLDPPLYLGAVSLQMGRPQDALRCLAEAHRIEAESPFVAWQLGMALVAAKEAAIAEGTPAETRHSELNLAVRALERAIGPDGLARWVKAPQRAWIEGMPGQGRSFVRRLAAKYPYACPVMGSDVAAMIRQAQMCLAQAHYRLCNYREAANVYTTVLRESAPSVPVLRGLGLSLAWLGQYDQAFVHLRTTHEREEPKDPITAGYLALCAARGKPVRPEDKPSNVAWGIGLLSGLRIKPDFEWASLYSAVFAEARDAGLSLRVEDQVRLCDVLAAVDATEPLAAGAYDHLATTFPEAVRPEHAFLYCRAAQRGYQGQRDLELFERTFRDRDAAAAFYAKRGWALDEVETTYLERWAAGRPGAFPEALGPAYPARGEAFLLARAEQQEQAGQREQAQATVEVLLKLAPRSALAHDRLARLLYRRGDVDRAVVLLDAWHALEPGDYRPLLRRAVLEQERGEHGASRLAIDRALERTTGPAHAAVAYLGARLTLQEDFRHAKATPTADGCPLASCERVLRLLNDCLQADPNHTDALWCLAAVRYLAGDRPGLGQLATAMRRPEVNSPRFHFLAAVCQLAAGEYHPVVEAAARAATDPFLAVEGAGLMAWAFLHVNNSTAANLALQKVASAPSSPSVQHARALLGRVGFTRGAYEDAIKWWTVLDAEKRAQWGFDAPLRGAVFLAGLAALAGSRFQQAADRFREAYGLDLKDARLGPLLTLALVKAGQQKLYNHAPANRAVHGSGSPTLVPGPGATTQVPGEVVVAEASPNGGAWSDAEAAALLLEQGIDGGCKDPAVIYLLALAHKRRNNTREARNALRRIDKPDANVLLQMGVLSLRELKPGLLQPLSQAEQDFARAWQADPASYEACYNLLLTRLSAGQIEPALALFPRAIEVAPGGDERRLLLHLQALLPAAGGERQPDAALAEISPADEQRLLRVVRSVGHLDVVGPVLDLLARSRPESAAVQEAYLESVLVRGKALLDRYDWIAAEKLLAALERAKWTSRPMVAALVNLRGCCACLAQDFEGGMRQFTAAVRQAGNDARLHQNLALGHEWNGELPQADPHWNRFLDLLDRRLPAPRGEPDYAQRLAFEALGRLATCYSDKERWGPALTYLERAHRLRPRETDVLDRLFHLYVQLNRHDDARNALQQLRNLRPGEPQNELYELTLIRVRTIDDLERKLTELEEIIRRYPHDPRVQDKAAEETGHLVSTATNLYDQLTTQVGKVVNQVRHLPNSQVNWPAVADVMHDMRAEYQKLRRAIGRCLTLAATEEQRRAFRDLGGRIDRKIEVCRSWGG
jgi:tetratricopeptide (TPR) repeat protein